MKKKYLFVNNATRWNKLLQKFHKIYKRIQSLISSDNLSLNEYNRLMTKLNGIFKRLEGMQSNIGLKLAGTSLVLMLSFVNSQAQTFSDAGMLKENVAQSDYLSSETSIDIVDIDGDGDLDIISGNNAGTVAKLINDGTGNFIMDEDISSDNGTIDVGSFSAPCLVDIDGDTKLDLIVGDNDGYIFYYRNDGAGNYLDMGKLQASGSDIDVGYKAKPTTCDLDGDGINELYIGNAGGSIRVFNNDGSGTIISAGMFYADGSPIYQQRSAPSFADVDDDGDLDLYVGEYYGAIKIYKNDGSGTFTADGSLFADGSAIDIGYYVHLSPDFADIDDDGDLDLYVGNADHNGMIRIYENDGSGVFSNSGNVQVGGLMPIQVTRKSAPDFADLDGDGDLELYVGEGNNIIHFDNDGSNLFSRIDTLEADGSFIDEDNSIPVFADVDDDGDLDLYVGMYGDGIKIFENNGSSVFTANGLLMSGGSAIGEGDYTYPSPAFADLDDDGDLDLYLGSADGRIDIYENDGTGNFTANGELQADGLTIDVGWNSTPRLGDIDNDGDIDILVGNSNFSPSFGNVYLYLNDGSGVFSNPFTGAIEADGSIVDVGRDAVVSLFDYDNDNDLDLVIGNYDGRLKLIENTYVATSVNQTNISEFSVNLHPNPASNNLQLTINSEKLDANVKILDISGKTVKQFTIEQFNNLTIDISDLQNGVYFVKLQGSKINKTIKFIKE